MRLAGAAMVRDEADIVEAFVRHNLERLATLAIVDHASADGTSEILAALADEGLAITVRRDETPAQLQPETLTRLARELLREGADLVFALDADEFLKLPDPDTLARALSAVPAGLHLALPWQTYVPARWLAPGANPLAIATRRLARERGGLSKVALTRALLAQHDTMLGPGSHTVLRMPGPEIRRLARLRSDIAALAHLPVRSAAQLVAKIRVGYAAHRAANRDDPALAYHWRELDHEFAAGGMPTPERLATIAANYGLAMADWQPRDAIALVDDPLPVGAPLRYAHLAQPRRHGTTPTADPGREIR